MIKAVLHDFDGTLVTRDILDVVCGIVGKEEESDKLNKEFQAGLRPGLPTIIERINFLKGVSLSQIKEKLDQNSYLMEGASEWVNFLKGQGIKVVLYSGNIQPILKYYQEKLGIDYIVGTKPKVEGETILGISEEDFLPGNWKLAGIEKVLDDLGIKAEETLAIGDSPADKSIFEFAGKSIAVNPKNGIEKEAKFVIENDLTKAIQIFLELIEEGEK